jgi:hypothetical protein
MTKFNSKLNVAFVLIAVIIVIIGGTFLLKPHNEGKPVEPVSFVAPSDWLTSSDSQSGVTFKYPPNIATTYIHTNDWPPKAQVTAGPFSCVPAGKETAVAGQTTQENISGRVYCVTKESEGAAGSTYIQYAYGGEVSGKMVFLTFTLRLVECDNYDDPQKTACKNERATFNINPIIDQIFQTISLLK